MNFRIVAVFHCDLLVQKLKIFNFSLFEITVLEQFYHQLKCFQEFSRYGWIPYSCRKRGLHNILKTSPTIYWSTLDSKKTAQRRSDLIVTQNLFHFTLCAGAFIVSLISNLINFPLENHILIMHVPVNQYKLIGFPINLPHHRNIQIGNDSFALFPRFIYHIHLEWLNTGIENRISASSWYTHTPEQIHDAEELLSWESIAQTCGIKCVFAFSESAGIDGCSMDWRSKCKILHRKSVFNVKIASNTCGRWDKWKVSHIHTHTHTEREERGQWVNLSVQYKDISSFL